MNRCITCKAIYIIEVAQTQLLHLLHAPKVPSPTHKGQIFPQPYLFKIQQQEKVTRNRKKLLPPSVYRSICRHWLLFATLTVCLIQKIMQVVSILFSRCFSICRYFKVDLFFYKFAIFF
jgi:hypothetical protein